MRRDPFGQGQPAMSERNMKKLALPLPRAHLRIGVTGHRIGAKFSQVQADAVRATVDRLLADITRLAGQTVESNNWAFAPGEAVVSTMSALAEGSDRILAEAGLAKGHPLNAILPFWRADYRADFESEASRKIFDGLLAQAGAVFELNGNRAAAERAYEAAGLLMLANADIVIAIWDQLPADGIGGTATIVEHAVAEGVPVILIDPRSPGEGVLLWRADLALPTARAGIEDVARRPLAPVLPQMISILLEPPEGDERAAFRSALAERPRRWNFALAYPFLLFLVAVRAVRCSDLYQPYHRQDGAARWRAYLDTDVRNARLSAVMTAKPLDAYSFIDHLSIRYAQIYRSVYVFSYVAAAAAVLLALLSLVLPPALKPSLLIAEVALIVVILVLIGEGARRQWHRRWLEYRRLAELLRHLRLLLPLATAARLERPGNRSSRARSWIRWYARALEREIPVPNLAVDRDYLAAVRDAVRHAELKSQIAYNRNNAIAMRKAGERLHTLGSSLFFATFVVGIADLAVYFLWPDIANAYQEWAVVLTALFPTIGAAVNAIRAQGDFQSVAERSEETAINLEALDAALLEEPPEFARLADRVEKVADLLMADLVEWHVLFRTLPLSLPA
jgi:hypothetical protein